MIEDFRDKLAHVLKVAELSRTRLSKLAGVDKSVASRWASGATRPSEANLDALTRGLNATLPNLKFSDWSRPLPDFVRNVGSSGHDGNGVTAPLAPLVASRPSIAVLPFSNMSGDRDQEFFGDGIAEDILTALSKLRWLHVVARHSSFAYKGKSVDMRQVGRDLGVRYVLEGSVRRSGQRVRITGQLIDATTGSHVWAERYDRELTDIFALQDEIVGAVLSAINPAIVDAERQRAFHKPTHSLDAWEAYQRGLWHHSKRDAAETELARALFQRAIALDPNFAPAYLGLCLVHIADAIVFKRADYAQAMSMAEAMARKAISLDEGSTSARVNLGYVYRLKGQLKDALREAHHALALDPASAEAHGLLGVTLTFVGELRAARQVLTTALELGPRDPRRPVWRTHMALASYFERDYETASDAARLAVEEFPFYPTAYRILAVCLGQAGMTIEAAAALKRAVELSPDSEARSLGRRPPFYGAEQNALFLDGLRKAGWRE